MSIDKTRIKLSILVVTHNQENLVSRCLNSILRQKMNFMYEIIVSDDASTDNTWNIIQKYVQENKGIIFGYQVDASKINPIITSDRCGFNKANAFLQSKGEYFVNIDADDFLLGNDIYQIQVDMLEKHPECTMCMQNVAIYSEGEPVKFEKFWFNKKKFQHESVISASEYILDNYFILNQAFVVRRNYLSNPASKFGKHFNDSIITYYHLQFGKIVYVDRAQYAYVLSDKSINSSRHGLDLEVFMFSLTLYWTILIPHFSGLFLRAGLKPIQRMMKKTITASQLSPETIKWLEQFPGFCFRMFLKDNITVSYKIRKSAIRLLAQIINKIGIHWSPVYKLFYILLCNSKSLNKKFNFVPE